MFSILNTETSSQATFKEDEGYTWHSWSKLQKSAKGGVKHALAQDILKIAKAVFLADRYYARSLRLGQRKRNISIEVPVSDKRRWNQEGVLDRLQDIISFASDDRWSIRFNDKESYRSWDLLELKDNNRIVALFSGGMDSCCGASYLAGQGLKPVFVTHSPPGREKAPRLIEKIWKANGRKDIDAIEHYVFKVNPDTKVFSDPIRRTRPFYYLSLAIAVAIDNGINRVQMSENGAMALSLPMRSGSYGAMRTRQAHKFIRDGYVDILNKLTPEFKGWEIINPFEFATKGEASKHLTKCADFVDEMPTCEYIGQQSGVIRRWKKDHPELAKDWNMGNGPQCGICEPCIGRRSALRKAGIDDPDSKYYFNAPWILKRNIRPIEKIKTTKTRKGNEEELDKLPPLLNKACSHPHWMLAFAQQVDSMDSFSFGIKYMPELLSYSYNNGLQHNFEGHHDLVKRFSTEVLAFLNP